MLRDGHGQQNHTTFTAKFGRRSNTWVRGGAVEAEQSGASAARERFGLGRAEALRRPCVEPPPHILVPPVGGHLRVLWEVTAQHTRWINEIRSFKLRLGMRSRSKHKPVLAVGGQQVQRRLPRVFRRLGQPVRARALNISIRIFGKRLHAFP